jgi:hypothetical protein
LRFWIFISIACLGVSAFNTQTSVSYDPGIGYFLGILLLEFYGVFLSVIVIARLIVQYVRKIKPKPCLSEAKAINSVDTFLFLTTGIVASIFTFKFFAFSLAGFPHGFLIHGGLSLILISLTGISIGFLPRDKKNFHFKILIFILGLSCGLLLFSAPGAFYPYVVIQSAQHIAGSNLYCIGLNRRSRLLNSLEDLTLLTMDKNDFAHHAVLLVEKGDATFEPYHWSYFESKFLPGIVNWANDNKPSISCRPARDFIKKIPWVGNVEAQDMDFYFHDNFLKIPKEYAPRVSSNSIFLTAEAPSFKPAKRERLYAGMEVRSREWMESLHKDYESLPPTGKIGNLNEIKNAQNGMDWYYRFNKNGQLETVAGCYSSHTPETACSHRFYRNGAMYTFYHGRELLANSDEMEKNLFDLFESLKEN